MNKLQAARQAAGLTQQQLADQTGISLSTIQKYERDARDINNATMSNVVKIAEALNCHPKDILTDKKFIELENGQNDGISPALKNFLTTVGEIQSEHRQELIAEHKKRLQAVTMFKELTPEEQVTVLKECAEHIGWTVSKKK